LGIGGGQWLSALFIEVFQHGTQRAATGV